MTWGGTDSRGYSGECDLDLGHYQRYLGINLSRDHNITTGKINLEVGLRERRGDYLGKTVQVVPHVTNLIQEWIERVARIPIDESGAEPDVCIGTSSTFPTARWTGRPLTLS